MFLQGNQVGRGRSTMSLTCCLRELLQFVAPTFHPSHEGSQGLRGDTTPLQSETTNSLLYISSTQHNLPLAQTKKGSLINSCGILGIYNTLIVTASQLNVAFYFNVNITLE